MLPPTEAEVQPSLYNRVKTFFKSFGNSDMIQKYKNEIYDAMFYDLKKQIENDDSDANDFWSLANIFMSMLSGVKRINAYRLSEYQYKFDESLEKVFIYLQINRFSFEFLFHRNLLQ